MKYRCIFVKEGYTNREYRVKLLSVWCFIHHLSSVFFRTLIRYTVNCVWRNVDGDVSAL